jgi:hypothetical protein
LRASANEHTEKISPGLSAMKSRLRKLVFFILSISYLNACSTQGGFYQENHPVHGQFSPEATILLPIAVVGVVALGAAMTQGGNRHGGFHREDPRWDFLRANGVWACRNAADGQFLDNSRCAGLPLIDNWPET